MLLVQAQFQRGGRAHQADAAAWQAKAAQVVDDRFNDVQHRYARAGRDVGVPKMGRVARDGDQLRAGILQKAHALNHMGQGAFAAGHIGAGAVGNAGIVAQQGGDVLLVNRGGRQRRQA
ncbi:hypothetical protein D3C73_1339840 [compost metagenome]